MTGVAVLLVLISAFAHATWNLLAKRSTTPEVTTWWMSAAATVLMFPVAIVLLVISPPSLAGWVFIAGTIALHVVYFTALGRAYRHGDLSVVYPVARGLGLTLIPLFGVFLLKEEMSAVAMAGVAMVLAGIIAIGVSSRPSGAVRSRRGLSGLLRDRGIMFAVLTGLMIGSYSALDKEGVKHVTPVLYMFFITAGGGVMLLFIRRDYRVHHFREEWRRHRRAIVVGGVLQFTAYALVLSAFRLSPVSYVGPFRELAIGIGVVLGALVLKEHVTRVRASGAAAIAAGALTIALAP